MSRDIHNTSNFIHQVVKCEEEFITKALHMCTRLWQALQYSEVGFLIFVIVFKVQGVLIWSGTIIERCQDELKVSGIILRNGNHRVGF